MSRRAGDNPSSERRKLERLGEMSERQPLRAQGALDVGSGRPRTERRQARFAIEVKEPREPFELEAHHRWVAGHDVDSSRHRCAAAPGNDTQSGRCRRLEDGFELVLAHRSNDGVGKGGNGSGANPNEVGEPAAPRVAKSIEIVRRRLGEELRKRPPSGSAVTRKVRSRKWGRIPQTLREKRQERSRGGEVNVFETPTVDSLSPGLHSLAPARCSIFSSR